MKLKQYVTLKSENNIIEKLHGKTGIIEKTYYLKNTKIPCSFWVRFHKPEKITDTIILKGLFVNHKDILI
tara:strand:+ start:21 stop:230 length:210 start_codon:yes stop_codon:yes gene_type:complete